jgi:TonB family protein
MMAFPIWVDNLIAYSLQIAILASVGTLLICLFRLRVPRVLLVYWQVLLFACLLIPIIQPWEHPVHVTKVGARAAVFYGPPTAAVAAEAKPSGSIIPEAIAVVLGAGVCLRLMWLALGFFRLHVLLRNSQALVGAPPVSETLSSRIGVRARFFLSNEIDSPATFGILSPRIILPRSFSGMSEACREAVVCHELLHVRRRDWALVIIEEIIRSFYWFHPAVWWLLGRIHQAREQSVDHEVVRLTGSRQPYLDSLLEIARARGRPKAVPAPLFLRERYLVQRVALLLKEVSMNSLRLAVSLVGIAVLLAGTVLLAARWFPLAGAPVLAQEQSTNPKVAPPLREPIRVGGNVQESKLIHKVEPVYPELAKRARITGRVVLMVTVNEEGLVWDVQVLSGHPLLNEAAISAVRQWRYQPTLLNGVPVPVTATVTVLFALNGSPPPPAGPLTAPSPFIGALYPGGPLLDTVLNMALSVIQPDGLGGYIIFRAAPIDERGSPSSNAEYFHSPELAYDKEQLHRLAEAGWPVDLAKSTPVAYLFIVDEAGRIKNLTRIQGPEIPELEGELARMHVVAPGMRGSTPVSSSCVIEIRLQAPSQAIEQPDNSTISGTVTDASGAVVRGATVTLRSRGAVMVMKSITDSAGVYRFLKVPPGSHSVTVEMQGFQSQTFFTEVPAENAALIRLNFVLK